MPKLIHSEKAPKAIGPYSQAVAVGNFLFCSGQIPLNPETMEVEAGNIEIQTERVLKNLTAVLAANGMGLHNVVKTTVFIKDMNEFPLINAVYEKMFGTHRPARSTVEVARLPRDVKVEIECIAAIS